MQRKMNLGLGGKGDSAGERTLDKEKRVFQHRAFKRVTKTPMKKRKHAKSNEKKEKRAFTFSFELGLFERTWGNRGVPQGEGKRRKKSP